MATRNQRRRKAALRRDELLAAQAEAFRLESERKAALEARKALLNPVFYEGLFVPHKRRGQGTALDSGKAKLAPGKTLPKPVEFGPLRGDGERGRGELARSCLGGKRKTRFRRH